MAEYDQIAQLCADILQRYGHNKIDTEHLLLALIEQSESTLSQIMEIRNIDSKVLTKELDEILRSNSKAHVFGVEDGQIFLTPEIARIIDRANRIAYEYRDNFISGEHIFIALLSERETPAVRILESFGLSSERAHTALLRIRGINKPIQLFTGLITEKKPQRPEKSLNVFLCHSSGDKPKVRELYHQLIKEGIDPWFDEVNLLPGHDWQNEIPKAVRNSDVVLVCLSKGSITKAGYVQKEIKLALDVADEQPQGTIFIIPVKLEECDVPERLIRWQWVNLFDDSGYQRLIRSLNGRAETKNNG